jgi:hypothetical protein
MKKLIYIDHLVRVLGLDTEKALRAIHTRDGDAERMAL